MVHQTPATDNDILIGERAALPTVAHAAQTLRPWLSRLAAAVRRAPKTAVDAFARWWMRRRTVRVLAVLDDHILKDLGITRSSLGRWADGDVRAWRKINRRR